MQGLLIVEALAPLLRPYLPIALAAAVLAGVSSLTTVGILALIDHALKNGLPLTGSLVFALLCALMLGAKIGSVRANSRIVQGVMADLRKSIVDDLLQAPIPVLERMQNHRVTIALNHDIEQLTDFVRGLPYLFVSILTALGCIAYLFYISWRLAAVAALVAIVPVYVIRHTLNAAYALFYAERDARELLQKEIDTLAAGFKELRLNQPRRAGFRNRRLFTKIDEVRSLTQRNFNIFVTAEALDAASAFFIIGVLLAAQPLLGEPTQTLGTFIVALLYLREPVNYVVGYLPMFGRATTSFRQIMKLRDDLARSERLLEKAEAVREPSRIELRGVTYVYADIGQTPSFALGPIDLDVLGGETLFIVGENGSGKTTLIKLLLGLYPPASGEILVDGVRVTDDNRDSYRQRFSAVFFDYCLFDDVASGPENAEAANDYLARMELSEKTAVIDGVFSTTALSAGQKKRLALVSAYAEGRPILVLDEWAAEQDPTFRRVFYTEILPDLKRRGKTLICVSHDDRYFDAADRVIHIVDGRIA